jgi:hypothetical protein
VDFSEGINAVVGLRLDGEDCGIEAGITRQAILDQYIDGTFLGTPQTYYYSIGLQDEIYSTDEPQWCSESEDGEECQNYANDDVFEADGKPDIEITPDQLGGGNEAFIVGIGITGYNDGKGCAINIYPQVTDIFMSEGEYYPWTGDDVEDPEDPGAVEE